jgi:hypothetical protein
MINEVRVLSQEIWEQRPCRSCEAKRLCAFEHHRIAVALQPTGGLVQWRWPESVRNFNPADLIKKPR